jgi:hypothetical protein
MEKINIAPQPGGVFGVDTNMKKMRADFLAAILAVSFALPALL